MPPESFLGVDTCKAKRGWFPLEVKKTAILEKKGKNFCGGSCRTTDCIKDGRDKRAHPNHFSPFRDGEAEIQRGESRPSSHSEEGAE